MALSPDGRMIVTGGYEGLGLNCGTPPPGSRSGNRSTDTPVLSLPWLSARTAISWPDGVL